MWKVKLNDVSKMDNVHPALLLDDICILEPISFGHFAKDFHFALMGFWPSQQKVTNSMIFHGFGVFATDFTRYYLRRE